MKQKRQKMNKSTRIFPMSSPMQVSYMFYLHNSSIYMYKWNNKQHNNVIEIVNYYLFFGSILVICRFISLSLPLYLFISLSISFELLFSNHVSQNRQLQAIHCGHLSLLPTQPHSPIPQFYRFRFFVCRQLAFGCNSHLSCVQAVYCITYSLICDKFCQASREIDRR